MSRVRADPITAALAHPTRRSLYISLSNSDEMSTVQLQNIVDVDRYNLYHHLKKLASLGLIENHRDEGRARWWKIAQSVNLPEILSVSNVVSTPTHSVNASQGSQPRLDGANTHVISLEGSSLAFVERANASAPATISTIRKIGLFIRDVEVSSGI